MDVQWIGLGFRAFSLQRLGGAKLRATESALRVVSQINLMAVQGAKRHPGVIKLGTGCLVRNSTQDLSLFRSVILRPTNLPWKDYKLCFWGGYRLLTRFAGELSKIERQNCII